MFGLGTITRKVFGTQNDRKVKSVRPLIEKINALEPEFEALSDAQLIEKTAEFKSRYENGETLDALLPEAFANCREGAKRALGLRAFDVQLIGGIFLHRGNIAEMKTGEGKTLVATFPAYLNALTGRGVHVVAPEGHADVPHESRQVKGVLEGVVDRALEHVLVQVVISIIQ